ncbi:MAG: hypothetical protein GTN62_10150 [Gemmatimonadales bacterium]|nr:hypothetical protein [Gemmatimonadales bacterium]NIN11907.1 hypothetical protein [Gemmatimonadales bacterium]NIN50457.1 hypothetical protein [Gemmatimonadales bacterium]NIP07921.1 hypothetical protein [Gemmatimonadales bacterium]NIR01945.1 hypothetical protein [Gemmatimonadales bacterium]
MSDHWTERLSAYVDGELEAGERDALEKHLAGCEQCRAVLKQLHGVKAWAEGYAGQPPRADIWPRIAATIRQRQEGAVVEDIQVARRRRRRPSIRVPYAIAAGIALAAVAGGSWWLARATAPQPEPQVVAAFAPTTGRSPELAILAAEKYGGAIAELERALMLGQSRLDTATVRVVQEKLAVIDRAIAEARRALAKDPNSSYLADHFASMMRRKLALLRNAAVVAGPRS